MNIVLIGYRGSGKSSIGRRLADKLWLKFVDTDMLIAERAGQTIKEIFAVEGEPGFRDREAAVLAEVCAQDGQVIAAGGGAILRPENVAAMKRATSASLALPGPPPAPAAPGGKIVWLKAQPEVLFARIAADTATNATRPNLTAVGGLEEVKKLLEQRAPLYQAAADASLDVTYLTVDDAILHLTRLL